MRVNLSGGTIWVDCGDKDQTDLHTHTQRPQLEFREPGGGDSIYVSLSYDQLEQLGKQIERALVDSDYRQERRRERAEECALQAALFGG